MKLTAAVRKLKGVGDTTERKLSKLKIQTAGDLLLHYPRRYEDYSRITPIAMAIPGKITVKGRITQVNTRRTQRGRTVTTALIDDGSGSVQAVWFNQPYRAENLPRNTEVYVSGELKFAYNQYALQSPSLERAGDFPKSAARIVPIYPETEGISSRQLRHWLSQILPARVTDPIPVTVLKSHRLMDKSRALTQIHFPSSMPELEAARRRLAFEELYILLLALRKIKTENMALTAPMISLDLPAIKKLVAQLPFTLTDSQRKCAWKITRDMQRPYPMNRLLQGDVGSGKTVIAGLAAAVAAGSGYQTALLAPTEVLAAQHYETVKGILKPLKIETGLLSGSTRLVERRKILYGLKNGTIAVCMGTHALLEEPVNWHKLGLTIFDEQHRFGVKQRSKLRKQADITPHFLSMTATPIPRSLALTIYGDLDISTLTELPPGRKPVITKVVTNTRTAYENLQKLISAGKQLYVVCPLIEESDVMGVKSVEQEVRLLKQRLHGTRIAGLHGRMKSEEKSRIMATFKAGTIDVLVSTTVIEVGIDVPNATGMIIEGAERFGLATLHQLRGRVGRSEDQAYCFLKPSTPEHSSKRLKLLERYQDGRLLAEKDLEIRGAGQLYGERQHGELDFRLVQLTDTELIAEAKQAVEQTGEITRHSELDRLVEKRIKQKHLN